MYRLLQIDELQRPEHYFLTPEDDCFYYTEYTSDANFSYSPANDLISNFKKSPEFRDQPQWTHKARSIQQVIDILAGSLLPASNLKDVILVPMPPSKIKSHPYYDNRMMEVLLGLQARDPGIDLREILSCRENREAFHAMTNKRSPAKIAGNLLIGARHCDGSKNKILLIDDVITTGAHFKACKNKLLEVLPGGVIKGLFIARRTFKADRQL